jgi:GT2 family glycosyltransferase
VIVVDNASSDATVEGIQARFPWVRLIASQENLGFTKGNNRGYAESRGEYIFFLNPDTEIINTEESSAKEESRQQNSTLASEATHYGAPSGPRTTQDSLWKLYRTIRDDPQVGMVGPQLRYADGSIQSSRRRFPDQLTGFFESTWLGQAWPDNPLSRQLHMSDWPATIRHDVDWLVGAAMLVRRQVLDDMAGPFDEGFFMYSEELDLCRRIKLAGWRIVYVPEAVVVHYEGRSSEQMVVARHIHFNTSKVRYYRKYFGNGWAELLRRYLLLEFRVQTLLEWLKLRVGHKRQLRITRLQAYREVIRSQLAEKP